MPKKANEVTVKYCHIQPRYGRYGISGYDVMVKDMDNILFATKRLAKQWAKSNGYDELT